MVKEEICGEEREIKWRKVVLKPAVEVTRDGVRRVSQSRGSAANSFSAKRPRCSC